MSDAIPGSPAASVQATVIKLQAESGRTHKVHRLRWKDGDKPEKPPVQGTPPAWMTWLLDLASSLSDASRFLVWGLGIVVVAVLAISARHFVQLRSFDRRTRAAAAASDVRDLDVRPESLPDDVAGTAWRLWEAGDVCAALSLLYRAALSRLIHLHGVPITVSTTEGECVDLARTRLSPAAHAYLRRMVRAREASTYGGRPLSLAMGEALCTGFAAQFDTAAEESAS